MPTSILVGDIGSTKSSWWYKTDQTHQVHLEGFNPAVHPMESGKRLIKKLAEEVESVDISTIWYYGAGVIDPNTVQLLTQMLLSYFPQSTVHVASDLVGAAIASCGNEPGTVAILGTGSHAALFDGQKIIQQAVSLGYILGDEGGGCDLGKALLQAYFYREMPEDLVSEMDKRLLGGRSGLLVQIKASATPNQYLAEFAQVAVLHQQHPWVKELVSMRFKLFVKRHVVPLSPTGPVHIVGSIGCIFASLIEHELASCGLKAGNFIKDPAQRLFETHLNYGRKEK
jgi:N-acetylglucosamine kinase-like BadF-type ATPase